MPSTTPAAAPMLRLECERASVDVAPAIGGAIAAFRVQGVDVLRPASGEAVANADIRAFGCYPLVPFSNRIAHARFAFGGASFELARNMGDHPHAIHGVGWQRRWQTVAAATDRATIEFAHEPDGCGWPFAFRARESFVLREQSGSVALAVTLSIESLDPRAFPFGLGLHPFFVRPAGTRLAFRAEGVYDTDATRLPIAHRQPPPAWTFDPPRATDDCDIDNVFTGWDGHARIEPGGMPFDVTIDADRALSHLVVYAPPGAGFIAVEPVTHATDAFNRAAAGDLRTGMRVLAPGRCFSCTMRIRVAPRGAASR